MDKTRKTVDAWFRKSSERLAEIEAGKIELIPRGDDKAVWAIRVNCVERFHNRIPVVGPGVRIPYIAPKQDGFMLSVGFGRVGDEHHDHMIEFHKRRNIRWEYSRAGRARNYAGVILPPSSSSDLFLGVRGKVGIALSDSNRVIFEELITGLVKALEAEHRMSADFLEALGRVNHSEEEQGGAGQPATAPKLKSKGEKNPKPESEGRSQ